jgi:hypothetical protein
MPTIDVERPIDTFNAGGWTASAGDLEDVVGDDNDATYIFNNDSGQILYRFASYAPSADHQVHRMRFRLRGYTNDASNTTRVEFRNGGGIPVSSVVLLPTISNILTFNGPWGIALPQYANVIASQTMGIRRLTAAAHTSRITEVYWDIDTREIPTFVADITDAAGVSQDAGTVTDTNAPFIILSSLDYDGLPARRYEIDIENTDSGSVVQTIADIGVPPSSIRLEPQVSANYEARITIYSTIRNGEEYASDVTTLTWALSFTPPVAPTLVVTANGCDGTTSPHVEVCWTEPTPGATEFDSEPAIEIVRTDCSGERAIYVAPESFTGCFCDHTMSINDPGYFCGERAVQGLRTRSGTASGTISANDTVPLSITGDIEITMDLALLNWQTPFKGRILGKSGSYFVDIGNWDGGTPRLIFGWTDTTTSFVRSTESFPFDPMERVRLKITHDVNDGAGSRVTTFYYDRGNGFQLFGEPVVFGTAGDIDDSGNALLYGSLGTVVPAPVAYYYALEVRNGIGGTVVASPDMTDTSQGWAVGDDNGDTGTDAQGNVWTIGGGGSSGIQLEACQVQYRVRYWGLVSGSLVASAWTVGTAQTIENTEPSNDWFRGSLDMALCPDRSHGSVRPFGAFQPRRGGIPTVITGTPGGRNYNLRIPITSEAELVDLEKILADPLFFYQPSDQGDVWLAPNQTSVEVTKVGRVRVLSVDTVAVNPQPQPDPASFFEG